MLRRTKVKLEKQKLPRIFYSLRKAKHFQMTVPCMYNFRSLSNKFLTISEVPLTNEALSIIIYVKISRYAMLRQIKRCKRVLYLVLHRTKKTKICKLKTVQKTRLRCEKHRGKRVSVSGYIMVSPFFHVSVAAFITDETITIIQEYYRIYFVFLNFDETKQAR